MLKGNIVIDFFPSLMLSPTLIILELMVHFLEVTVVAKSTSSKLHNSVDVL